MGTIFNNKSSVFNRSKPLLTDGCCDITQPCCGPIAEPKYSQFLMSKNPNSKTFMGKKQRMYDGCCEDYSADCCIDSCTCSSDFDLYLVIGTDPNPRAIPPVITIDKSVDLSVRPFQIQVGFTNTSTSCSSIIDSITASTTEPDDITFLITTVFPVDVPEGASIALTRINIGTAIEVGTYEVSIAYELCGQLNLIELIIEIIP